MVRRGKKEIVTVDVYKENYVPLKEKASAKRYGVAEYVNHRLEMALKRDEFLSSLAPHLSVDSSEGDLIVIRDDGLRGFVELRLREGALYCDHDRTTDCYHTRFAWASNEIIGLFETDKKKRERARVDRAAKALVLLA
jgi:hypothetical protein